VGSLTPIAEASEVGSTTVLSWTGSTPTPTEEGEGGRPPSYEGSARSVLTDHYLSTIQDREERECARRNIEWLRDNGFTVKGKFIDGKYVVSFTDDPLVVNRPVMSLRQIVKAKALLFLQQK